MYAIQTNGLTKRYGSLTALEPLDLSVAPGERFALLGVNGAGKSTAIKLLTGLTAPTAGDATVGGFSICRQPEQVKGIIGVSPQETAIAPGLSVFENPLMFCSFICKQILRIKPQRTSHKRLFKFRQSSS